MNIGDVPGLIGIRQYFHRQINDAEQTRISKWEKQRTPKSPQKAEGINVISEEDMEQILEKKVETEYDLNTLQQISTYFDFVWLDAMIESAKGNVENAMKLFFRFIEAHIIEAQHINDVVIDDVEEEKKDEDDTNSDKEEEELTFFTKTFLNNIAHLGLKCCIDAQDWSSYDALYQLLRKTFENNLDRLSEIRGYNVDYIESLSNFDRGEMQKAAENLSEWELNLGVNPLKSATIPTTTRCDLFKTADMYHLQALLLSVTEQNAANTQTNKNASDSKLATKFCKDIFRDPLRVVSHSHYNDQYSMLLRIGCARAVELKDLNVLNSFVHCIRFDENDILNKTSYDKYLLISYLKMSDLSLAYRTISGLFRSEEAKYENNKHKNKMDKIFHDNLQIYADFMYTFVRWNLIVGNYALAKQTLKKLNICSSPAHLFLSTLAQNKHAEKSNTLEKLGNWVQSINVAKQKWLPVRYTTTAQYQSYSYLQMTQLLQTEHMNDENVSDIVTFIHKSLPNADALLNKYRIAAHFAEKNVNVNEEMAINKAAMCCYIEAVESWPKGKSNWLLLARFTTKMSDALSVPTATDYDKHKIENILDESDKEKARKVFNTMISIMHETTMKVNHQTSLNQDFESASFANLRSNLDWIGLSQPQLTKINQILVSRRNLILEYVRIRINCYHEILSRFSNMNMTETNEYERDDNVSLCLDLFTILCNYGLDLIANISPILECTPFDAWVQLIPQLFSRLGHSQPIIRQEIEKLVMGITRSYPSKIIFPVLSGIDSNVQSIQSTSNLQMALQRTLAKLRESDKLSLVLSQVSDMKLELARISVLWEDKWLQIIQEIKHMMPSRIRLLEHEINLIIKNSISSSPSSSKHSSAHSSPSKQHEIESELLLERYQLIMAPILELLTSLESTITSIPTTPHEYKFERKYGRRINILLKKFRSPSCISVKSPSVLWTSELLVLLDEVSSLFSMHKAWNLNEISPLLHRLSDTVISIPGMENTHNTNDNNKILLQSVNNRVDIIRSKTRPKKLSFVGNDGRSYQYLLKSREDLNLDERIMQFLRNCNGLISRHAYNYNKCKYNTLYNQQLRTRWYEVIPLDKKTGLIRFVDHATPLYLIFRAWQDNYGKPIAEDHNNSKRRGTGVDSYRALIDKYLKEINPSYSCQTLARHKWPISVLKKAFTEISTKAPKELIWRELWCSSSSINDFFFKCTTFSQSVALSSVLGWFIGLGDRHIGNILLDFRTGEVVHIDFNVCFEKGYRLRVPELVPFRLTKSMVYALGLSGTTQTKGHFYCTCQYILNLLRGNSRNWIELFSAFIYDPISEWLTKQSADYLQRQIMDLTMGLRLMLARLGGGKQQMTQIAHSSMSKRRKKKAARKSHSVWVENEIKCDGDADFRSLLKQIQSFSLKLLKQLPLMADTDIKLDALQKSMTLCLQSFVNGYKSLAMDCFVGDHNFLHNFIDSQPTAQKAKHFYESYSHSHNITTRIPPKYCALLHEKAVELDRNWRRLIRVSYEMVHQSLCLVAFYKCVINAIFNPFQYYKTSQMFAFFNKNEYNDLMASLPWNNNAVIGKELAFYEKGLSAIKQMNNEYSLSQQQYASNNIFGISNVMATQLFEEKLYNLHQYDLNIRAFIIIFQVYNVKQRFAFLDTASRADLTASIIDIQEKISVNRDIELKLQLATMFIHHLLSFKGITPKTIPQIDNKNWRLSLDKCMKFITNISVLIDKTVHIIHGTTEDDNIYDYDEEEEDEHIYDDNIYDLSDGNKEYMNIFKSFIVEIVEISRKCNFDIAFTQNQQNKAMSFSCFNTKELYSHWTQIYDSLKFLCSFDDSDNEEREEKINENDAENENKNGKYPFLSVFKMLLQIFKMFNKLTKAHNSIITCLKHTKQQRVIDKNLANNNESLVFIEKGMEIICSIIILLKIDKLMDDKSDCYNILSSSIMIKYVAKYVLHNLDYWLYYSSSTKTNKTTNCLPIYAGLCANLFDALLGIIIESSLFAVFNNHCKIKCFSNDEIRDKLNVIKKSLANNDQRAIGDINQRISTWINNLYKDQGPSSVIIQCKNGQYHHKWIIGLLKKCLICVKWLFPNENNENNEEKYIDPQLFKLLNEPNWCISDLYSMKNINAKCLLPYLSYLNNEFSNILSTLKSTHYSYMTFEDELVTTMEEWSGDLYPNKDNNLNNANKEDEDEEDEEEDDDDEHEEYLDEDENKESAQLQDNENNINDENNMETTPEMSASAMTARNLKRSKSPFNKKRKKENKIKEMEEIISKSMQEIQNRRNIHLLMINNYNKFGLILNRIYALELSRRSCEFFTAFHLEYGQMILDGNCNKNKNKTINYNSYNIEFNALLSSLNEKYGHINPMLELVLKYVSPHSALYLICQRLQKNYKIMQQDLEVIKSFILAKSQEKKNENANSNQTLLSLQHRISEMLQCDSNIYEKLRNNNNNINTLIYRSINLQIELDNLQIAISSVLKHDLISQLSPFTKLNKISEREANTNSMAEITPNDVDNDDEEDEHYNDKYRNGLLSYFVTMDIGNIVSVINEERSKHGYEIVQYMAYKLNGTQHNIHKSSHYNTIEEFDQIKKVKCVGSNHCDKQSDLEMKTSILTGCYPLFKLQSQINMKNNASSNCNNNWTQKDVLQQLDTMIDEATDNNRLCRMYQGWAPWM